MSQVIPLFPPRTCFACVHYTEGWCRQFEEPIDSEIFAATDCDSYEVA